MYAQIHSLHVDSLNSIKSLWELDLGEDISEELWEDALNKDTSHLSVQTMDWYSTTFYIAPI